MRWYPFVNAETNPLSGGVNDSAEVTTRSVGKWDSDTSPYLVANEWICGNIATMLRLPIPPFSLYRDGTTKRAKRMFGSLRISDNTPPDVDPVKCVECLPLISAGIVMFDIFVANRDRHLGNLKVDDPLNPTAVYIIDHERALFGAVKKGAVVRLTEVWETLGVTTGNRLLGSDHCLIDLLTSAADVAYWIERVQTIPVWFLEDLCNEECVPRRLVGPVTRFLTYRKQIFRDLIRTHKSEFPGIADWGLHL
jgi:hypothetical protein